MFFITKSLKFKNDFKLIIKHKYAFIRGVSNKYTVMQNLYKVNPKSYTDVCSVMYPITQFTVHISMFYFDVICKMYDMVTLMHLPVEIL